MAVLHLQTGVPKDITLAAKVGKQCPQIARRVRDTRCQVKVA